VTRRVRKRIACGRTRVVCKTPGMAHALRHELDKAGVLSRRSGKVVLTTASATVLKAARRRAKVSVRHGRTR
jgi:hypothetical protein